MTSRDWCFFFLGIDVFLLLNISLDLVMQYRRKR